MSDVVIRVIKEQHFLVDADVWDSFGGLLPDDMADLEMLHDEVKLWDEILIKSEVMEGDKG